MSRLGINYGSNISSTKHLQNKPNSTSKTNLNINLVPGLISSNNNSHNKNNHLSSKISLNQSLSNDDILLSSTNVTEHNYHNYKYNQDKLNTIESLDSAKKHSYNNVIQFSFERDRDKILSDRTYHESNKI